MTRTRLTRTVAFFGAGALGLLCACNYVLGIEDVAPAAPILDGCWEPGGFDEQGCYKTGPECPLESHEQIINACTAAECVWFDDETRLTKTGPDGGRRTLPESPGEGGGGEGGGTSTGMNERCSDLANLSAPLPLPKPRPIVYVTGSDAILTILDELGPRLADEMMIVYAEQRSCDGAAAVIRDISMEGEATYWGRDGTGEQARRQCDLDPEGIRADIGVSDVFAESCPLGLLELPNGIEDRHGPIQAELFIVPETSKQDVISVDAAFNVYGFGADSGVEPWTDSSLIYRRPTSSGTQNMIAVAIGVAPELWQGMEKERGGELREAVEAMSHTPNDERVIGIYDVPSARKNEGAYKLLHFQAEGQRCGFLPDSRPNLVDQQNVRDGHYTLWGPLHLYVKKDNPKPEVMEVVDYVSMAKQLPGVTADDTSLLSVIINANFVPRCAMHVERDREVGPVKPFKHERPCHCFYDDLRAGEVSCSRCPCSDGYSCHYGFCEPD